jgi:hypothetical protein
LPPGLPADIAAAAVEDEIVGAVPGLGLVVTSVTKVTLRKASCFKIVMLFLA